MSQAPALSSERTLAILARLEALGIRLGLDSMRSLLAALGNPQLQYRTVLVAGSNGKGSTSALLAAMASAAGYRTALYTSPHLETVEERLRIDGRAIASEALGAILERVVAVSEERLAISPTYFEALTAAAFLWFAAERVDLAVVEVGLGGRLDATNLCEPSLSLVTSISLEHREMLGDTLAAIAGEKAGVLRGGRPALFWVDDEEAAAALWEAAQRTGALLRDAEREVEIVRRDHQGWSGQNVTLTTPQARRRLRLRLLGRHQARNLALATRAAEILAPLGFPSLDDRAIAAGAAACRWPGRAECVILPADAAGLEGGGLGLDDVPVRRGERGGRERRVLLDAAHNAEGAAALAGFLAASRRRTGEVDVVFGALADKDATEMLASLTPHARNLILTVPDSTRARPAEELRQMARREAWIEPAPAAALERALQLGADTLVVCGSIFLVGEVRLLLRRRFGVPEPATDLL